VPLLALAGVAVVVATNAGEVGAALELISLRALAALAALHLLALTLRAAAWGLCLRAAGAPVPARDLHTTSGFRFLADTLVPTYAGAWVRIGLLKRLLAARSPTVGQMISADAVILLVEAVITVVLVVTVTATLGLEWWLPLVVAALAAAGAAFAWTMRRRFAHRPFVRTLDVLTHSRRLLPFAALLALVLAVQPLRFWIALQAVGFDPSAFEALLTFIVTSLYGGLPIGPGPASVGATASVFGAEGLGAAAAAGLVLAATAFVAASAYAAWAALALVLGGNGQPTDPVDPLRDLAAEPLENGREEVGGTQRTLG